MADFELNLPFDDFQVNPGNWKTAASITPGTNQLVKIRSLRLYGEGISGNAKPIKFRFARLDTGGEAGTATTVTARKSNPEIGLTPRSTCKALYTAEPDIVTNSESHHMEFHPQGGNAENFHLDRLVCSPDHPIALQFLAQSGETAVKITGHLSFEE